MRWTAGYDAAQGAGAEVGGGVEFDAAFALCAAAGHLGGSFFGCHCLLVFGRGFLLFWLGILEAWWKLEGGEIGLVVSDWGGEVQWLGREVDEVELGWEV